MSVGISSALKNTGAAGGACAAGASCCGAASACCQKGLATAQSGQGDMAQILQELQRLAQMDPNGVAQALKQNPEFAKLLGGAV